jgi:hypothetical protein
LFVDTNLFSTPVVARSTYFIRERPSRYLKGTVMSRARQIAGWVLTCLLTALFVASAAGKLTRAAQVVDALQKWGLGDQVLLIGAGELASASA